GPPAPPRASRHAGSCNCWSPAARHTSEQPVHVPAWGALPAIGALAEQPVAAALLVLHPVIVAQPRAGPVLPPFRGDAFRPLGERDPVQHLAPAEGQRRL